MSVSINLPGIMQVGAGAIKHLPDVVASLQCQRPCIITDPTMLKLGLVEEVLQIMSHFSAPPAVFAEVMPEPDDRSIDAAVDKVTQGKYDCLIALGGGSAIDSAKAIALLATHGGHIRDYKMPRQIVEHSIPVIAIPTTAGTGSECTRATIISDSQSAEKMLCMGSGLMPKAAIIDYRLTLTVPFRVAADTGIDALTHAIEAYVSQKANPFSDQQAIAAMGLIAPNLLDACMQPDNMKAKEQMMLGASLAGMAFSNASVALVHGMSRPLGVHFHVPHGMSNAMLLPAVTAFSIPGDARKYAHCALHMGLVSCVDDWQLCHQKLIRFLLKINKTLNVPSMSAFGISSKDYKDKLDIMADQAIASGSVANNPLLADHSAITALYRRVYT